jgi:hypothetical protein
MSKPGIVLFPCYDMILLVHYFVFSPLVNLLLSFHLLA